jgi:hypothetical protein
MGPSAELVAAAFAMHSQVVHDAAIVELISQGVAP